MPKRVYQWQGEPVNVRFGTVKINEVKDKPLYWYNYEAVALGLDRIPAVEVTYKEPGGDKQVFCIANHFGIGVRKLEAGGYPNYTHLSLPSYPGSFEEFTADQWEKEKFKALNDDMVEFRKHERARDSWQAKKYPHEHREREKMFKFNSPVRLWEIK